MRVSFHLIRRVSTPSFLAIFIHCFTLQKNEKEKHWKILCRII